MGDWEERRREEKNVDRMLAFTSEEQEAYRMVELLLCAAGKLCDQRTCMAHWNLKEVHEFFKIFARELKLSGPLYTTDGKYSPAVVLYYGRKVLPPKTFMFILPELHYNNAPWRIDKRRDKRRVLEAARVVCKTWLPKWDWDSVR